jgi:hypothetical protein
MNNEIMASPSAATAAPPTPNSTHSPNLSDDDSIKLVWQDDAGADLRSLFAKDMMTMTQQIDGWGSEDSEDDGGCEVGGACNNDNT